MSVFGQFGDTNDGMQLGFPEPTTFTFFLCQVKVFDETLPTMSKSFFEEVFPNSECPAGYRLPSDRLRPPFVPELVDDGPPFDLGVGAEVAPTSLDTALD